MFTFHGTANEGIKIPADVGRPIKNNIVYRAAIRCFIVFFHWLPFEIMELRDKHDKNPHSAALLNN